MTDALANLLGRDVLGVRDLSAEELLALVERADAYKRSAPGPLLAGRRIGLLFGVPSTRTRVAFFAAAARLGASTEFLRVDDLQVANRETFEDTARVLDRYLDALVVRMYDMQHYGEGRQRLRLMADAMNAPVVNALDDYEHPCQVLADLQTIREQFGSDHLCSSRVVVTWAYSERQKSPGVPHSLMAAAGLLGLNLVIAHPVGFELDSNYVTWARERAALSGGSIEFSNDLLDAASGAQVIYAKSWKALAADGEEDRQARQAVRAAWMVDDRVMEAASDEAVYMDCLPSVRGEEVAPEVKDGPRSVIFDQAENRMWTQMALLSAVLAEQGN